MQQALHTPDATESQRDSRAAATLSQGELTELEQQILAFEKQWWKYAGAKESAIAEQFGVNVTRYYQLLNALLDKPAAMAAEPLLVKRLRRVREQRHRDRTARRGAVTPR